MNLIISSPTWFLPFSQQPNKHISPTTIIKKKVYLTGSEEIEVLPEAMLFSRRIIFMVADSTHNPTTQNLIPQSPPKKLKTFPQKNEEIIKQIEKREKPNFPSPHPSTEQPQKKKKNRRKRISKLKNRTQQNLTKPLFFFFSP